MALARGAVGGNVGVVVLCRPHSILHKLVYKIVRTVERERRLHIRIHGDGRKVVRFPLRVALDEHILEAEYGELCLVCIYAAFADVLNLLQRRGALFGGALNVLLREFAFTVEHFAEAQNQPLPSPCIYGKRHISRYVLAKIKHLCALGGDYKFGI